MNKTILSVENLTKIYEDKKNQSEVKALNNVNDELAKDNNGMFSAGTGTNAGDMINSVGGLNNGGGSGSEQLNTVMQQVLNELKLIKGFEEATAKNTKNIRSGNLANGGASATGN